MNARTLIMAVTAISFAAVGAADAASGKKRKKMRHHGPAVVHVAPSPYALPGPRPVWAAPWQCFTDEGYGRYRPCDAGPTVSGAAR
jgi:hypothetical protein